MSLGYYIWEDDRAVPCDLFTWGRWMAENQEARVWLQTELAWPPVTEPAVLVSSVFLGLDHRFADEGPPLIFETMAFEMPAFEELHQRRFWVPGPMMAFHGELVDGYLSRGMATVAHQRSILAKAKAS